MVSAWRDLGFVTRNPHATPDNGVPAYGRSTRATPARDDALRRRGPRRRAGGGGDRPVAAAPRAHGRDRRGVGVSRRPHRRGARTAGPRRAGAPRRLGRLRGGGRSSRVVRHARRLGRRRGRRQPVRALDARARVAARAPGVRRAARGSGRGRRRGRSPACAAGRLPPHARRLAADDPPRRRGRAALGGRDGRRRHGAPRALRARPGRAEGGPGPAGRRQRRLRAGSDGSGGGRGPGRRVPRRLVVLGAAAGRAGDRRAPQRRGHRRRGRPAGARRLGRSAAPPAAHAGAADGGGVAGEARGAQRPHAAPGHGRRRRLGRRRRRGRDDRSALVAGDRESAARRDLASYAIEERMRGDAGALQRYAAFIASEHAGDRAAAAHHYGREGRWARAPFWRRRRDRATVGAPAAP